MNNVCLFSEKNLHPLDMAVLLVPSLSLMSPKLHLDKHRKKFYEINEMRSYILEECLSEILYDYELQIK